MDFIRSFARIEGRAAEPGGGAATSAVTPAPSAVPVNTALPTISGTPQAGQALTATDGTWTNSPTSFTYQWQRAAPAPDVSSFNGTSGSVITVCAKPFTTENANKSWSITNPDFQTLIYEVRSGDKWSADPAGKEREKVLYVAASIIALMLIFPY